MIMSLKWTTNILIALFLRCECSFITHKAQVGGAFSRTLNFPPSSLLAATIQNEKSIETTSNESGSPTIAIVGAGVGGLSIASRIASSPQLPPSARVVVVEKNSREMVGGRCGSFTRNVSGLGQFRFERGPSLLLLKDVYLDLFRDCGRDAKDFDLQIEQCAPAYQVVFDDGEAIQLGFPAGVATMNNLDDDLKTLEAISRQKMNEYESHGSERWDEYMRSCEAFLDCGLPNFIEESLDLKSFPNFIIEATRDGFKVKNNV